ncbi:hypothetical protein [Vibrio japonicus]|uniref:Transcriptional regulator n=1 Tax=Vibrio japonicus TaxID=1824638 RepID=A0ABY5LLH5_9VIBR|nr:hypothetical protein [Vibrio japonicus]UUM32964.1 hypothetical protein NP165_15540 [Vibrio japonicus]
MNANQANVVQSAEVALSPKRDVILREMASLAKMASVIAVPLLLLSLAWI